MSKTSPPMSIKGLSPSYSYLYKSEFTPLNVARGCCTESLSAYLPPVTTVSSVSKKQILPQCVTRACRPHKSIRMVLLQKAPGGGGGMLLHGAPCLGSCAGNTIKQPG